MRILLYYMLAVNLFAFAAFGVDKIKARRGMWRLSETFLFALALAGGSVGAWCGMKVWHHKTLHSRFRYGLPAILLLQTGLFFYIYIKYWSI